MFAACLMFLFGLAVIAMICMGSDRAAYLLLNVGSHVFEGEEHVHNGPTPRRPGAKVERRVTPLMKKKIGEKYKWKCACGCGQKLSFDYHVDHIIPLWKGGTNEESNLQPLNPRCHVFKTSLENQVL